jgi:uncharacterized protein YndB with AHSA1/START domain
MSGKDKADLIDDEIRHSTFMRAPAEVAYDAIATAQGLDAWFTTGAQVDARPQGSIRFRWVEFGPDRVSAEDGGPVLEATRPVRFVFQWHPDHGDYATTVEIDFEAADRGTVVRLRESGFRDTPEGLRAMLDCSTGWGEAMTLWKYYVEHGISY